MVARTVEMKLSPRRRTEGIVEPLSGRHYGAVCDNKPPQVSRLVCYRATFLSYRTTSLMPAPYQSSPGVPLTEQLAEDRRSSRPVVRLNPNLDSSYPWVVRVLIQNCWLRRSGLPVSMKEKRYDH
jgi:hypothetical protein